MSQGPYFPHDPISLTLCADLSQPYSHTPIDAVWQLYLQENSPIALRTSFGLRAQSFQLYPIFMIDKVGYRGINEFLSPPQIRKILPNAIQISLNPNPHCTAGFELWAASPNTLEGRITLKNIDNSTHELGARVAARLVSFSNKNGMNFTKRKTMTYLKGESNEMVISLLMDGLHRPIISPELALENTRILSHNESLNIFWRCHVSEGTEPVDDRVFSIFPVNWDAEMARLNLRQQSRELNISTPNLEWDIAFRMHQHQAQQLLNNHPDDEDTLTVLTGRNPNTHQQSGNTLPNALEIWQLIQAFLPSQLDVCAKIFENYLQNLPKPSRDNPSVELPFPILCQTAWDIHHRLDDKTFLQTVYPHLRSLLFAWFWPQNDRDQDGIPEWSSIAQSNLQHLPDFDLLNPQGLITPINTIETLGLAALLVKECDSLNLMARVLADKQTENVLSMLQGKLQMRIAELREANLLSRDRGSHKAHQAESYFEGIFEDFPKQPIIISPESRINIKIQPELQIRKPSGLVLHGLDANGNKLSEEIKAENVHWLPGVFLFTSQSIFSRVDGIAGPLDGNTKLHIYRCDLTRADISHLMAWDPQTDHPVMQELVETWLTDKNGPTLFGLPTLLTMPKPEKVSGSSHIGWNGLLIKHVLSIGEYALAFKLFKRLMQATIKGLSQTHLISESFASSNANPSGKANSIAGVLPLGLFLEILGVRIYSPTKVRVGGTNPVPWPVTLRYLGLEITRDGKNSTIIMPNGTKHIHFGSTMKTFTMEETE